MTDEAAPSDVVRELEIDGLPFLDRMRSSDARRQFLIDTRVAERAYPPPIIALAILTDLSGDKKGSQLILDRLDARTPDAWKVRISEVRAKLQT